MQLAVNTVMPDGFIDGEVIFICTKHSFFPKRINQLIDHCSNIWNSLEKDQKIASKPELKFTREDALNKIYYMRVLSLPELISSIYKAKHFVENESNKVSLKEINFQFTDSQAFLCNKKLNIKFENPY